MDTNNFMSPRQSLVKIIRTDFEKTPQFPDFKLLKKENFLRYGKNIPTYQS